MLPSSNGNVWPEGEEADAVSASWSTTTTDAEPSAAETCKAHQEITASSSCSFKSMLESDWFINNSFTPLPAQDFFKPFISADLAFSANPSFLTDIDSQSQPSSSSSFFPPNSYMSSLFSAISSDPFDQNGYFDGNNANLFLPNNPLCTSSNSDFSGFLGTPELNLPEGLQGFENGVVFPNRVNNVGLRPLEVLPIDGLQQQLQLQQQQQRPTLFEKRVALRQNSVAAAAAAAAADKCVSLEEKREGDGMKLEKKKKRNRDRDSEAEQEDVDDVSCLNYDSDEAKLNNNLDGPNGSNDNDGADENLKGKKKGPPAKNLMAERRRRKKLNDRLYMLRSIVPKISKMDRASILGDAIEYLKELLQRINDLHQELEATPSGSSMQQTSNFQPLTPTLPTLPCRVKEEVCPSSLPSPKNNQPARVEVRLSEGRAVNIHMFCARRPGLLLSTISALDNLGLDIQQAVISCFNGFALDVFRAEQCSEGQDVLPEQVKAVLLDSAGYHGVM